MKQTLRRFTAIALCFVMLTALLASCGTPTNTPTQNPTNTPTQNPAVVHVGFNGNTWNDNVDTGVNAETVAKQDENGYYFVDHALALNKLDNKYMTELSLTKPVALTMGNSELKVSNRTYYANTDVKYIVVNVTTAGKLTVSKANVADFMAGKAEYTDAKTVDATAGEFKIELDISVGLDETIVLGSEADTAKIASYTVTTESADGLYVVSGGEAGDKRIAVNAAVEIRKLSTLFTDEQFSIIKKYAFGNMGKFGAAVGSYSGYIHKDANILSGKEFTKIYIPVYRTLKNKDGKYQFTINVADKSSYEIKRTYTLEFGKDEYGWTDVQTWFEYYVVDISDLNIVTSENETISLLANNDSVTPMVAQKSTSPDELINAMTAAGVAGSIINAGKSSQRVDENVYLAVNYEYYETGKTATLEENIAALKLREAETDETTAEDKYFDALRAYYKDKNVSVIGDSISTYTGWNNNTTYNSTIGNNAVYYSDGILTNVRYTYWMRVINQLGMKLCVNNAWSGCKVNETKQSRAPIRATEMDNDNGTPRDPSDDINPDIILVYLGINDLDNTGVRYGDLYEKIKDVAEADRKAVIDEWFADVLKATENGTKLAAVTNYKTFDQGYAIMLYNMTQKYKDAQIVCCTLIYNKVNYFDQTYTEYNTVISALAEYFGGTVADFNTYSGINRTNYETYSVDPEKSLHPNVWGHDMMADVIIDALAKVAGITK